jgi:hypothetical protein
MRDPVTSLWVVATAGLLLAACTPSSHEPGTPAAREAASLAAQGEDSARADAVRRVEELEAAIGDARRRIAEAETSRSLSRQQRLVLSETRRAVVVANVALQKARTALAAGDFSGASQATEGAADKLRSVAEGKSVTSAQAPTGGKK